MNSSRFVLYSKLLTRLYFPASENQSQEGPEFPRHVGNKGILDAYDAVSTDFSTQNSFSK